ncbi:Zn-dependent exopeptidase [Panus rudis PR-1116 ss-1]|nr:Zn-dependent exopeptidase [Panus rudis PR-1116 ss-1]
MASRHAGEQPGSADGGNNLQMPHPSLNKPIPDGHNRPTLFHSLYQKTNSVLSVAADENYIYSGSQRDDILVWDKRTFSLHTTLRGHTASVLALEYAPDRKWLFSASGDSTIRVWSTETFTLLFLLIPHFDTDAGDLFSLAWSPSLSTIYFGCQNTSLQWFTFTPDLSIPPERENAHQHSLDSALRSAGVTHGASTPRRVHKFFDSYPQYTRRPADLQARNPTCPLSSSGLSTPSSTSGTCLIAQDTQDPLAVIQIPARNVAWSAHYGYVYCMALSPSTREGSDDLPQNEIGRQPSRLVTGSGDATVKVWKLDSPTPEHQHTFDCGEGAVLSIVVRGDTVFAGCQDGYVKVWDLETRTLVRSIIVCENVDVLSLSMLHSDIYTCSANGQVKRFSAMFDPTASWQAHDGIVLSSVITYIRGSSGSPGSRRPVLVTGGNDDYIKVWEVDPPEVRQPQVADFREIGAQHDSDASNETLIYALSKFISIPSVSSSPSHREHCRQAAIWLRKSLNQLGAEASLLPTGDNTNPLVLAHFRGNRTKGKPRRILFYGHYDVIPAPPEGWLSDPFSLYALNGYLYGRGITDNKGPVMAVACAAADLLRRRCLDVDLVMLIEGEEESGSGGFAETVQRYKEQIGPIDSILVSNSTWISEGTPCITYGLRGVIHCRIKITSGGPDLHSGVDGGVAREPMMDMIKLLGTLTDDDRRVTIPGFYDDVRPLTAQERQLFKVLSGVTQTPASTLSAKWREPSLTIHDVEVSGPKNSTVIPSSVESRVSLRIVPDQSLTQVSTALQDFIRTQFNTFQSSNLLEVSVSHTADWWLGSLDDPWFTALENAIREEWGVEPLRIREGGSIPSIPYLEKEFGCHALHLPMGQSTDQAHLPNERMCLPNLQRGKAVIERFLTAAKDI